MDETELRAQALRLYGRYQREIVEGLAFCPWAKTARLAGSVRTDVILGTPETATVVDAVCGIADDAATEIGLLLFPQLRLDRHPFRRFVGAVRQQYEDRVGRGHTVVAMADFHPHVAEAPKDAERVVPFVRRSPDPTIQVVRMSALQRVRPEGGEGTSFIDVAELDLAAIAAAGGLPQPLPMHERVARANWKTIEQRGLSSVRSLLEDIHRDRARTYAALGLPPAPWEAAPD